MRKCIAALLSVLFVLLSLASCGETTSEYFVRTRRDSSGRLCVSLARTSKDEVALSEKELYSIYEGACAAFTEVYDALSPDTHSELGLLNAECETILDISPDVGAVVTYAFGLSELTAGLYEPCGGSLTRLLDSDPSPSKKAISQAISHIGKDKFSLSGTVLKKTDPLARIDLGALRDAYAIMAAVDYLKESTCAYGTVTFNGTAGAFGKKPDGSPFSVELCSGPQGVFNITEGYVSLVSKDFGTAVDFTDGKVDSPINCAVVFSKDARVCTVMASVAYVNGSESLLSLYEKGELSFEAVMTEKDNSLTFTKYAEKEGLFVPETTIKDKR